MSATDLILVGATFLLILKTFQAKTHGIDILNVVIDICTILVANTTTRYMIRIVMKQSSFDIFSTIFMLTIVLQCTLTFYKQVIAFRV
jgi:hypothetical protein